jgi:nicotinate-nucleotide adenylyltransferase
MNVAVLGGSFDPPHMGHYWISRQVLEKRKDIEKVLLIPVAKHQWKPIIASVDDRLKMLNTLVSENIEVSDIEIKRGGISYTEDTLKELVKKYEKVYWIVGSDILQEFDKWDKKEELLSLTTFLVFPRDPYLMPKELPSGFQPILGDDLITSNISSTKVKSRIRQNLSIKNFVTKEVEEYIQHNKLYI